MGGKKKLTKEDVAWLIEFHATDLDGFEEYCERNGVVFALACSYGKDSLASLHVIKDILHYPLHSVFTTDVWATQTISANLPPVDEFKKKADKWILDHYGIEVTHLCARDKNGNKLSYEDVFYRELTPRSKTVKVEREREQNAVRIPDTNRRMVSVKTQALLCGTDSRTAPFGGGWCHELKQTIRIPDQQRRMVPLGSQDTTDFQQVLRPCQSGARCSSRGTSGFWMPPMTGGLKIRS